MYQHGVDDSIVDEKADARVGWEGSLAVLWRATLRVCIKARSSRRASA